MNEFRILRKRLMPNTDWHFFTGNLFAICSIIGWSQFFPRRDMGNLKKAEETLLQVTSSCCLAQADV
jgi:hypothetical protein